MLTIHFRPMTLDDIEQVHEVERVSFTLPWPERSFRYEVTQNKTAILRVAEASREEEGQALFRPSERRITRQIAGMIVIWMIVDEAHIGTIAVHPDYRRHGVGRLLLARSLLEARQGGARTAYLEVRRSNLAAQELYRQFGFIEVGVRAHYYAPDVTGGIREDALLLTLEKLDPAVLESFAAMALKGATEVNL